MREGNARDPHGVEAVGLGKGVGAGIPVEITVHSGQPRGAGFYSSVTGKVMRRVDLVGVRRLVGKA